MATSKELIDWNQVEIQAAIGAMQAMIQRGGIIPNMQYQYTLDADHHKVMAIEAALYARALVAAVSAVY